MSDIDRNKASSKSVSSVLDDSDCEDTAPGNADDRMSAELGAYRSSKTEPIQTDPDCCHAVTETSVFARDFSAMRAHIHCRWRNCQQT